jgi:hypothetical protein
MMDAGLRCEAIYTRTELDNYFAKLDNVSLRQALSELVTVDERLEIDQKYCIDHFANTSEWNNQAIGLFLKLTEKQNVLATAPITSLTIFEVPYLKKSNDPNNIKALAYIRAMIEKGRLPIPHESIALDIFKASEEITPI